MLPMADVPRFYAEQKGPDAVAVVHGSDELTWAQLERRSSQRARAFADRGVKPGDFVAVLLRNSNEFFETSFAIWKLGATIAPLSHRLPKGEAQALIDLLRPALVVGGDPDWNLPSMIPAGFEPDGYSDAPVFGPISRYWAATSSGGSTGLPKLIVQHRLAVTDPTVPFSPGMKPGMRLLNPGGPLYHTAPFFLTHFGLFMGGTVASMERFDPEESLRLIDRYKIQWMNMVPTMLHRVWTLPDEIRNRYDISSLERIGHTAAPMPVWLKEKWIEWVGAEKIGESYGGSESGSAVASIGGVEWMQHKGSVGRVDPAKVKIVGEDGESLGPNEVGEIFFRPIGGAGRTFHYIGAEPRQLLDGWDTLGDFGRVDEEGYLYIADRRTDMIIRGGANIFPAEVESALLTHPDVKSCAVIGLPDTDLGQRVHAVVELAPGVQTAAFLGDVAAALADILVINKHPQSYDFVQGSIRDDAGKVRRIALRDERLGWIDRGVEFQLRPDGRAAKAAVR